jgi:hypothetical protein
MPAGVIPLVLIGDVGMAWRHGSVPSLRGIVNLSMQFHGFDVLCQWVNWLEVGHFLLVALGNQDIVLVSCFSVWNLYHLTRLEILIHPPLGLGVHVSHTRQDRIKDVKHFERELGICTDCLMLSEWKWPNACILFENGIRGVESLCGFTAAVK